MIWLSLALASEEGFEREPYLQRMTSSEVTVVWRASDEHEGELCWGRNPNDLSKIKTFKKERRQFEARLKDLEPDTVYHYQVRNVDDGFITDIKTFRTPPVVGSEDRTRFWVVGDSGTGGLDQRAVYDAMRAVTAFREPDHFIHVGDMAYGSGLDIEFTLFFYWVYEDLLDEVPVWPAIGNHEGRTSNSEKQAGPYYEGYVLPTDGRGGGLASGTEAYYSVDIANVHLIVLDSHESPREVDGPMMTWLAEDVAATEQDWIIASWHHPPYTKGTHDSDRESQLIEMRENALPILESGGVDLVLAGHSHVYERSYLLDGAYETPTTTQGIEDEGLGQLPEPYTKPLGTHGNQGAVYVTAGHGGTGVGSFDVHPVMAVTEVANGSVLLDVQGPVLRLRNIREDGEITDTMTLTKGPAVVFEGPDDGVLVPGTTQTLSATRVGIDADVEFAWSCNGGVDWIATDAEFEVPNVNSADFVLRATAGFAEDWSDGGLVVRGEERCPHELPDTGGEYIAPPDETRCSALGPFAHGALWLLPFVLLWRRST